MMKCAAASLILLCILVSCSPLSKKSLTKEMVKTETRFQDHTALVVYDVAKRKTLFQYKPDKYFTPASNTKVLTLYACLKILGDSIPALKYVQKEDSLIVWGLGDPTFLYNETFNNFRVFNFLKSHPSKIFISTSNNYTTHFGPGWAWDDYNDYYSPERSSFPIYGNCFKVYPLPDQILVSPKYFEKFYQSADPKETVQLKREVSSNHFVLHPGTKKSFKEFTVPFHVNDNLTAELLADTLHREVRLASHVIEKSARLYYSVPVDSVYKVMMKESDNHIADQLLLTCSAVLSDSLKPEIAIREIKRRYFSQMQDPPVWVDGSGLSRYNLFTPRFLVDVWKDLYSSVSQERLFSLLATGGEPGTIKKWFKGDKPYVFGKTGTLSNNHNLSGYLITKKGKVLIFAFMNGNYTTKVNDIRNNMQRILNLYYENY
jgi:serine-type D-Ala-D-Ala carboxypeptidase/endopeptidase (penicillin-binding protein 4)